jgi:hypothetical protein
MLNDRCYFRIFLFNYSHTRARAGAAINTAAIATPVLKFLIFAYPFLEAWRFVTGPLGPASKGQAFPLVRLLDCLARDLQAGEQNLASPRYALNAVPHTVQTSDCRVSNVLTFRDVGLP